MEPQTRDAQKRSWLLALMQLKNLSGVEGTGGREGVISSGGRDAAKRYPRFEGAVSAYRINMFSCKGRWEEAGIE